MSSSTRAFLALTFLFWETVGLNLLLCLELPQGQMHCPFSVEHLLPENSFLLNFKKGTPEAEVWISKVRLRGSLLHMWGFVFSFSFFTMPVIKCTNEVLSLIWHEDSFFLLYFTRKSDWGSCLFSKRALAKISYMRTNQYSKNLCPQAKSIQTAESQYRFFSLTESPWLHFPKKSTSTQKTVLVFEYWVHLWQYIRTRSSLKVYINTI